MQKVEVQPRNKSKFDLLLVATTFSLVLFGLLTIYDASPIAALRDFGDKLYYFRNQLIWASLGIGVMGFFSLFNYHKILKLSPFILLFSVVSLIAVLVPHVGTEVYGARRWINISGFTFQPSELAKLSIIFYATYIMSKLKNFKIRIFDAAIVYIFPVFVATALVVLQPDLGTALIFLAVSLSIYFIGGAPLWHFFLSLPIVVAGALAAIIAEPYRLTRLKSFLDPSHDPQGASYQINQILTAISSGGFLGVGIGAARSKFAFIPEVHSDAILAIVIEELGFLGAVFLLSLFLFLIYRGIVIAKEAKDFEGKTLAMGIVALLAIQSLFNFASVVALVPLTGIPLPFISYGGSSLLITMAAIGILVNIKLNSK
ncbi:putative lipid II flippase FtsW [Candidatus Curtissbacteria bacterium]|nr:putative lipid II flippase FtsW [Candidatus Curtissbacteria bacterium]